MFSDIAKSGVGKQAAWTAFESVASKYMNSYAQSKKFFASDLDIVWRAMLEYWKKLTEGINPLNQKSPVDPAVKAFEKEMRRVAYAVTTQSFLLPKNKTIQSLFEDYCCDAIDNIKAKNLLENLDIDLCLNNLAEVLFISGFICGAHELSDNSYKNVQRILDKRWQKTE